MSQLQQTATLSTSGKMPMSMPVPHADSWQAICPLDDIWPSTGVCALMHGRQIAIFRMHDDVLYAIDNHDPHSGANVLSRGIIGDLGGEPVVASPIYKHHYQLRTGACVEDAGTQLHTYPVQLRDGMVWLNITA
ncbi:assimilatory nitrite reductase (NAD(P)H) small subunit [Methylobacillus rhizosphaerae]|uniref:Assimilatory nitrite reductase (NAD(P)H) small subunit n=1 Tax=Methylobacillus rhizosphaerae TaxID=551994 RepID=A0A239A765_9PROT|nr:nitrite reductase small subunit NirD [Methylobacillus rhizosphaerae]SNR90904.1 assimilatory nitrite reductase (NAD(P)H) small subunit [Methylobacillus rhizosphaerae]